MRALIISVFVCTLSPIVMSNTYFWDDQHNYVVDYDCNRIPDKMVHYDCSGSQDEKGNYNWDGNQDKMGNILVKTRQRWAILVSNSNELEPNV